MSTTAEAADTYNLPYILYDAYSHEVYVSSHPIHVYKELSSDTEAKGIAVLSMSRTVSQDMYLIRLMYSDALSQWVAEGVENFVSVPQQDGVFILGTSGSSNQYSGYIAVYGKTNLSRRQIYTNVEWNNTEKSTVELYSNDITQLPQGLTESAIQTIINQQLNTQTSSGNTAESLTSNTEVVYREYQEGTRTREEVQVLLEVYRDELSSLNPSTLLDAIQINNALTYNQTIQQIITSTTSTEVQEAIMEYLQEAVLIYLNWQEQEITLPDAMNAMEYPLGVLAGMLVTGDATTQADISAVNTALNFVQSLCENMSGSQDLNPNVSEELQKSDIDELLYLEQLLINSGEQTVNDISPSKSFTQAQKNETKQLMDIIWQNEFIKRLIPLCAGFMVVCVALGVKYKV